MPNSTLKFPDAGTGTAGEQSIDVTKEAAERLKKEMDEKKQLETKKPLEKLESLPEVNKGTEKDNGGKHLITLERQELFKQVAFELRTMQKHADGDDLVLTQHCSKVK